MYIVTNNTRIFVGEKLNPQIKRVESFIDEVIGEISQNIYTYEVFCRIDKRVTLDNNVEKILIYASSEDINQINVRQSVFDNIDTNNKDVVNGVIENYEVIKRKDAGNKFDDLRLKKIGEINIDSLIDSTTASKYKVLNDKEAFGTRKVFKERSGRNKKISVVSNLPNQNNQVKAYEKAHNKLLYTGNDPAAIVDDTALDSSQNFAELKKGIIPFRKKAKNLGYKKNSIGFLLQDAVKNNLNLYSEKEIISIEVDNRISLIPQEIKLSEQFITDMNNNFNILFIAITRDMRKIDLVQSTLNHDTAVLKSEYPAMDYEIGAIRVGRKVLLKIKNNEKIDRYFNVYARKLNSVTSPEYEKFKTIKKNVRVPAMSGVTIFRDDSMRSSYPVHFRVTMVHNNTEYANCQFTYVKGIKNEYFKSCFVGVSGIINDERISLKVKNIPYDVKKINIVKKNLSRNSKHYNRIKTLGANDLIDQMPVLVKRNGNVEFVDDDVEYDEAYEYKALLYDENGNKKESSTCFIEKYERRSNILKMRGFYNKVPGFDKTIGTNAYEVKVKIERIEDDVEKFFNSLFGDYYNLFEDDLKQIKDINGITYSLSVHTINEDTSETIYHGSFPVSNDLTSTFQLNVDADHNHIFKISPRVMLPTDVISNLEKTTELLAKKNHFKEFNRYSTAAAKKQLDVPANRTSGVGNKYSSRKARFKGRLEANNGYTGENNDLELYYDGSTGDILYLFANERSNKYQMRSELPFINSNVTYVDLNQRVASSKIRRNSVLLSSAEISTDIYESYFVVDDTLEAVDYFAMFYIQNNMLTFDGIAKPLNVKGRTSHTYIYKITGAIGLISFYCVPVFSGGKVGVPELIGAVTKETDGVINNVV